MIGKRTLNPSVDLTVVTALIFLAGASGARAAVVVDVPGYESKSIVLSGIDSRDEGPALAGHPAEPWAYAAVDFSGAPAPGYDGYNDHQVWRVDFSSDPPTTSSFSAGAYRTAAGSGPGENVLDSLFGSVGGLAVLQDGSVLIVENSIDLEGRGETIYRARDLNGDGDALDVVDVGGTATSETLVLIEPIAAPPGSGFGGFSGVQAEIDDEGNAYIITSDGSGTGEVLRIDDPTSDTPSIHVFFGGLDYGSGLTFDSTGRLYAGNVDLNFIDFSSTITIYRLTDTTADGVIGGGESEVVSYDQLGGLYDLAVSPEDAVYLTASNEVRVLNPSDGTSTLFAHDEAFTFLADLAFVARGGSFAPFGGPGGAILLVADPNSDGEITAITPATASRVVDWEWMR